LSWRYCSNNRGEAEICYTHPEWGSYEDVLLCNCLRGANKRPQETSTTYHLQITVYNILVM
jgi:hypothetical protein